MDINLLHQLFLKSSGVCTDTRALKKDAIFFALKGGNFNGNDFAAKAIEEGCSYVVVDEEVDNVPSSKIFKVEDVLTCMQLLANHHRHTLKGKVIALTGSNGKTTTKELLAAVLQAKYRTAFTKGNLNNHIGVPLTILATPQDIDFLVVEMGANHQGEIEVLCKIAEPDYGLIANIGKAHLEGFGGIEGVKKGKTEMYKHLNQMGKSVFFNNDEASISEFKKDLKSPIEYGGSAAIAVKSHEMKESFLKVNLVINGVQIAVQTHLFGEYNVNNVLTAAAIGSYFGVSPSGIKSSLEAYVPANNRSQVLLTPNGNELVVDAYNANPTSMKNAIIQFLGIHLNDGVLFIGDMRELGSEAEEEHRKIVELLKNSNCVVYFVGELFKKYGKKDLGIYFGDTKELIASGVLQNIRKKKILIKGSRGVALEQIVPHL